MIPNENFSCVHPVFSLYILLLFTMFELLTNWLMMKFYPKYDIIAIKKPQKCERV